MCLGVDQTSCSCAKALAGVVVLVVAAVVPEPVLEEPQAERDTTQLSTTKRRYRIGQAESRLRMVHFRCLLTIRPVCRDWTIHHFVERFFLNPLPPVFASVDNALTPTHMPGVDCLGFEERQSSAGMSAL